MDPQAPRQAGTGFGRHHGFVSTTLPGLEKLESRGRHRGGCLEAEPARLVGPALRHDPGHRCGSRRGWDQGVVIRTGGLRSPSPAAPWVSPTVHTHRSGGASRTVGGSVPSILAGDLQKTFARRCLSGLAMLPLQETLLVLRRKSRQASPRQVLEVSSQATHSLLADPAVDEMAHTGHTRTLLSLHADSDRSRPPVPR